MCQGTGWLRRYRRCDYFTFTLVEGTIAEEACGLEGKVVAAPTIARGPGLVIIL
jgi:hypothetical protein